MNDDVYYSTDTPAYQGPHNWQSPAAKQINNLTCTVLQIAAQVPLLLSYAYTIATLLVAKGGLGVYFPKHCAVALFVFPLICSIQAATTDIVLCDFTLLYDFTHEIPLPHGNREHDRLRYFILERAITTLQNKITAANGTNQAQALSHSPESHTTAIITETLYNALKKFSFSALVLDTFLPHQDDMSQDALWPEDEDNYDDTPSVHYTTNIMCHTPQIIDGVKVSLSKGFNNIRPQDLQKSL
eukprot:8561443-Ditylum_brightwellii.AAC.1